MSILEIIAEIQSQPTSKGKKDCLGYLWGLLQEREIPTPYCICDIAVNELHAHLCGDGLSCVQELGRYELEYTVTEERTTNYSYRTRAGNVPIENTNRIVKASWECPFCGATTLFRSVMVGNLMSSGKHVCADCQKPFQEGECIHLWHGCSLCNECIEK